jgi:hypothetical protein
MTGEEGGPKWFFNSMPVEARLARLVELAHLNRPAALPWDVI